MQQAKVLFLEDSPEATTIVATQLQHSLRGHRYAGSATSVAEARTAFDSIQSGELDVNVVLFGGSLGLKAPKAETDPAILAREIRERGLAVRTVGISSLPMHEFFGAEVDLDLQPLEGDRLLILENELDKLEEPSAL